MLSNLFSLRNYNWLKSKVMQGELLNCLQVFGTINFFILRVQSSNDGRASVQLKDGHISYFFMTENPVIRL